MASLVFPPPVCAIFWDGSGSAEHMYSHGNIRDILSEMTFVFADCMLVGVLGTFLALLERAVNEWSCRTRRTLLGMFSPGILLTLYHGPIIDCLLMPLYLHGLCFLSMTKCSQGQ